MLSESDFRESENLQTGLTANATGGLANRRAYRDAREGI